MKSGLSVIHLLATQKRGHFFNCFFIYAGARLLTRAIKGVTPLYLK